MKFQKSLLALAGVVLGLLQPAYARRPLKVFDLTLTWEKYAPDGFARQMILINGQFPGPLIEVNQGDAVEIRVRNRLPVNTTVHYHGIEMLRTPWSDGTPGLSQRHIQPGRDFTYRWKATQAGSYWYHSHEKSQTEDGLYGPIIIHRKADAARPFSQISSDPADIRAMLLAEAQTKPVLLSDHRHVTSEQGWAINLASGIETPCYDTLLVNGKGRVDCWSAQKIASLYTPEQRFFLSLGGNGTSFTPKGCLPASIIANVLSRKFPTNISTIPPEIFDVCTSTNASSEVFTINKQPNTAVTWASFDLIGAFGVITAAFSIDGYSMYIYAVDGNYITPQPVEAVQLANGDRYSIMIKLDKPGDYTMRTASLTMPKMFTGLATISYRDKTTSAPLVTNATSFLNDVGRNTSASVRFFDQSKMKAFPPRPIAQYANQTFKLAMRQVGTSYDWALNNTVYPMSLDDQAPLLFQPSPGRYNNVTITTLNNTWVDIIFQAVDYPMPPHPIHKHSNKMFLLGQGFGTFPWNTVAEAAQVNPSFFNFVDPPRRDGFVTPPAVQGPSWMAIRYHVVNPGAWLLHCHVQSHLRGGMSIAMQDGVDEWPTVPREYLDAR